MTIEYNDKQYILNIYFKPTENQYHPPKTNYFFIHFLYCEYFIF